MNKSRYLTAYIFVFLTFLLLTTRYGYLQLVIHKNLALDAVNNYSSQISTLPTRGNIIDRNGFVLATNKASYVVAALPKELKPHMKQILQKISLYVHLSPIDIKKLKAQLRNSKNYDWVIIKDDLTEKEIAKLTAHLYEIPEISVFARTKRFYPYKNIYAHSIGYVGRLSSEDKDELVKIDKDDNYLSNDSLGKSGLEKYYENYLRGKLGKKVIKTDAHGNETGFITNSPATDGDTIELTIDNNLQQIAWNLLGDHKGAIVAIDPKTGGILAFVSKPAYDPNWFVDGIDANDWEDLSNDKSKPLLNRASFGTFPPGSTFKPFMALTALDLGFRTPNSTYYDKGYYTLPGSKHVFHDSFRGGRGLINFTQAIYYSSDTFFYNLGVNMGIDNADKVLPMFGFGEKTGIDLPQEASGLLPSKAWKEKRFAHDPYQKNWLLVDNIPFAVGQGFNHYTPLQMAHAVSIIANNGVCVTPHFLKNILDDNGHIIESYAIQQKDLPINKSYFSFIKNAMQKVITEGTARGISSGLKYTMAGKTGTAQVVALDKNSRQAKYSGSNYKDHAWFIAFAPVDKPKIAIAVLVENGGWGASTAAPIARQLFDAYLLNNESTVIINQYKKPAHNPQSLNEESEDDE